MNGTTIGLIAVSMWSVTTLFVAYISTVPPLELIALVFFFGWVFMTAFQLYRRDNIRAHWNQPLSKYIFWLSTVGLYTILVFIAFLAVPIFEANILNYVWPVLLIVFAATINKERVSPVQILGGILGFAGAVTVFLPQNGHAAFADFQWGHGLSLISGCIWALYSALARNVKYPNGFLGPAFLVFALLVAALHFIFEKTVMPQPYEWCIVIILGFCRVSYAMWDYSMKNGDVILLASVSYFLPLLSSVFLVALGFGPHNPMIGLGAVMIIASCIIVNSPRLQILIRRKEIVK